MASEATGVCDHCGAVKRDGECAFCARCDEIGVVNGRDKWTRRNKRDTRS